METDKSKQAGVSEESGTNRVLKICIRFFSGLEIVFSGTISRKQVALKKYLKHDFKVLQLVCGLGKHS